MREEWRRSVSSIEILTGERNKIKNDIWSKNRPILGGFLLSATAEHGRGNPVSLTFIPTCAILRGSEVSSVVLRRQWPMWHTGINKLGRFSSQRKVKADETIIDQSGVGFQWRREGSGRFSGSPQSVGRPVRQLGGQRSPDVQARDSLADHQADRYQANRRYRHTGVSLRLYRRLLPALADQFTASAQSLRTMRASSFLFLYLRSFLFVFFNFFWYSLSVVFGVLLLNKRAGTEGDTSVRCIFQPIASLLGKMRA